ncbi:DUF2235 domain-containing protein [Iodidimonas sp. SYSU 1G8]|uniref:DUF2235 domain-containing protein n=1 Tax=Iodidimonas sp. SYSU 1G8 TaxID=3133967 RepID=UPI0031FEB9DB
MSKNIVIFSDGTGQEGGSGVNTNVYKLFNMVLDRSPQQTAFYDKGLGTGSRRLLAQATGYGISRNIIDCYRFLFENYQAGDQIFLFGFSRGATTVRSLSGMIHLFGMLPQSRPELIDTAYDIYKIEDRDRRVAAAEKFIARNHTMWVRIKFLGVWDTVAALGVPIGPLNAVVNAMPWFRHKFHDLKLSRSVENAYQALAIDEERETFHPVLWDPQIEPYQTMRQVWFCGAHTDVGGGYAEPGLSDIALQWMVDNAVRHGLLLYPNHRVTLDPRPDGMLHDSMASGVARFFRRKVRSWPVQTHGNPIVHPSVLARTMGRDNKPAPSRYAPWLLSGGYTYDRDGD